MAFKKGLPRPENAGRKKGTPNKSSLTLLGKCEALGFDPFNELLNFAKTGGLEGNDQLRLAALKEIAQYLYPKRKSLEHSGNISPELAEAAEGLQEMSNDEKIKLLEDQLKELKNG